MVAQAPTEGEAAPRCICGSEMKRMEVVRVFTYLDFLRGEDPVEEERFCHQEQMPCQTSRPRAI